MILKLLFFAFIGVMIYKFLGGTLPSMGSKKSTGGKKSKVSKREKKKLEEDTLVECEKCGTYVTVKESILIQGRYYCDECA